MNRYVVEELNGRSHWEKQKSDGMLSHGPGPPERYCMWKDHVILSVAHVGKKTQKVNKNQYPALEHRIKHKETSHKYWFAIELNRLDSIPIVPYLYGK